MGGPNRSTPPGIAEYGNQEDIKTKSGSNTLVRMRVSLTRSKKRAREQKESRGRTRMGLFMEHFFLYSEQNVSAFLGRTFLHFYISSRIAAFGHTLVSLYL